MALKLYGREAAAASFILLYNIGREGLKTMAVYSSPLLLLPAVLPVLLYHIGREAVAV